MTNSVPNVQRTRNIRNRKTRVYNYWEGTRALSGFKHLTSLSLLGISSLDYLAEIQGCLKSSSANLNSLTISLSKDLALKSRKATEPPPADDTSDTDEDTAGVSLQATSSAIAHGTTEADVRREKLAHDTILTRIFDMQNISMEGRRLEKNLALSGERASLSASRDDLAKDLQSIADFQKENISGTESDSIRRAFLEMLQKTAAKYLEIPQKSLEKMDSTKDLKPEDHKVSSQPHKSSLLPPGNHAGSSANTSKPSFSVPINFEPTESFDFDSFLKGEFSSSGHPISQSLQSIWTSDGWKAQGLPNLQTSSGSSAIPYSTGQGNSSKTSFPMTFDQGILNMMNSASMSDIPKIIDTSISGKNKHSVSKAPELHKFEPPPTDSTSTLPSDLSMFDNEGFDGVDVDLEHPDEDAADLNSDQEAVSDQDEHLPSPSKKPKIEGNVSSDMTPMAGFDHQTAKGKFREFHSTTNEELSPDQAMHEWIRSNHGLKLKEFKTQWIPIKASIVGRALDLDVLKRITLLNAGNQEPFWKLLARLQHNHTTKIAFESIHTDHVSAAFLTFLTTFKGLTELFLLERSNKNELESAGAKTNVDIKEIRQSGLQKQLVSLKRLTIKNESDATWDLDATTILILASQSKQLKELAISLSSKNFVSLSDFS